MLRFGGRACNSAHMTARVMWPLQKSASFGEKFEEYVSWRVETRRAMWHLQKSVAFGENFKSLYD